MDRRLKSQQIFLITFLCCLSSMFSTRVIAQSSWPTYLAPSLDAGIMVGYTGGYRKGVIVNPANSGSEMNGGSQDSSEIGAQMRLLFGSEYCFRPFIYLNGAKPIGAPISILLGKVFFPFTNATKLDLTTNWLARLGIGVSTPWLYETFQLGAGAGAAVINQTLETFVGEATVTTFNQNKTSVRPSFMGSVTWSLSPCCSLKCLNHEYLVTAEITADSQPVINGSAAFAGGTINTRVHQAWVFRGDLVFSVNIG